MGLFDFLKKTTSSGNTDYSIIFNKVIEQAIAKNAGYSFQAFDTTDEYKSLSLNGRDSKLGLLFSCFPNVIKLAKNDINKNYTQCSYGLRLISFLLKELALSDDELLKVSEGIRNLNGVYAYRYELPYKIVLSKIENAVRANGLNLVLTKALQNLIINSEYASADDRRFNELIYFLLQGNPNLEVNEHDSWGKSAIQYLETLNESQRANWVALFKLSKQASSKSEPTQKWLKEAEPILALIGHEVFVMKMIEWLDQIKIKIQEIHKDKGYRFDFMRDENHDIIKGLIWCTGLVNNHEMNVKLDDYATWAYKKKPGVGPISAKTGTAIMCAFSMLPIKDGVSRLSKFKSKVKNNTILKSIDKFIRVAAERNGVGLDKIQELSVPDFNIKDGLFEIQMGEFTAVYLVEEKTISWRKGIKIQKSTPQEVKENFIDEFKSFKNTIKEIDSLLPVIKERLERSYLEQRFWSFKDWSLNYLHHSLTSVIAGKLIWHFYDENRKTQGFIIDKKIVDVKGKEISWLNDSCYVQLWHPIGFTMDEIIEWRNFLKDHNLVQPFKQAYREVYILTDAELRTESYSNRFAAHILRQHQFAALCRQRGWHYTLMGNWDSHNTPYIEINSFGITASFYVNADWQENATNAAGIFNYITTDQVRFTRNREPLTMQDVPAMVFTEIMRDVDLFVGVTSLGNDPTWQDGGDVFMNTYWREYSFKDLTESAKIRRDVLLSIVPKLKIASQCSFDKKFLIVNGKVRNYKIHLGSGNILMEPNDQYLCIVPDGSKRSKENVFLPFEGDNLLSIILSKAIMLSEDDKITDPTIISQINRK
jgi:hypothetical protein